MAGSELILPEWLLVIMAAAGVGQCGSVEVIREMFMPPSSLAPTATILCSAALSFCNGVYAATIHYTLVEIFGPVISEMFMPRSSMVARRAPLLLQLQIHRNTSRNPIKSLCLLSGPFSENFKGGFQKLLSGFFLIRGGVPPSRKEK